MISRMVLAHVFLSLASNEVTVRYAAPTTLTTTSSDADCVEIAELSENQGAELTNHSPLIRIFTTTFNRLNKHQNIIPLTESISSLDQKVIARTRM